MWSKEPPQIEALTAERDALRSENESLVKRLGAAITMRDAFRALLEDVKRLLPVRESNWNGDISGVAVELSWCLAEAKEERDALRERVGKLEAKLRDIPREVAAQHAAEFGDDWELMRRPAFWMGVLGVQPSEEDR